MAQCEYCKSYLRDDEIECGKCPNCGALMPEYPVMKTVSGLQAAYLEYGYPMMKGTADLIIRSGTLVR